MIDQVKTDKRALARLKVDIVPTSTKNITADLISDAEFSFSIGNGTV